MILFVGIQKYLYGEDVVSYILECLKGIYKPTLSNDGWSITVEFHFCLLLPFLLFIFYKWNYSVLKMAFLEIVIRTLSIKFEVQRSAIISNKTFLRSLKAKTSSGSVVKFVGNRVALCLSKCRH